jgi:uncharacterized damage-inducible protein DinB
MPGQAPFHTDEHDLLLGFVAQQREVMRLTAYGLTDDQARRAAVSPSSLSVGGLLKHVTFVEEGWVDLMLERQRPAAGEDDYADNFVMRADESLADLLARSIAVGEETERVVRAIPDLGQRVPVPPGVPWYPQDLDAWSVRWVLVHLVSETARHAGHADIVREAVDGGTAFPIMAAAEGWPATPWMQPWEPAS